MSNEPNFSVDSETADTDNDLDVFSADFFGQKEAPPEKTNPEEPEVVDDTVDAKDEEDTHPDDDTVETEDDNDSDDSDDEPDLDLKPEPKKKSRFQERIDELTGKAREAERREKEALDRIKALEDSLNKDTKTNTSTQKTANNNDEPSPDDKLEDGTDKYPLGEFDPSYIRDLTKHAFSQEKAALEAETKAKAEAQAKEAQMDKARAELQTEWQAKLGPAQERYPDFRERGEELISSFSDLDPAYGEYLTATLMSMEYGPDVLYHLANNPDEAHRIIDMGPQKASIALGRLEARFEQDGDNKVSVKSTKAPPPPPANKGAAVSRGRVRPDTDDLDAFSADFFKGR